MARDYTTSAGERIDIIVFDEYGAVAGYLERVLDHVANRGLADGGPLLAAGTIVHLPDVNLPTAATRTVRIWD